MQKNFCIKVLNFAPDINFSDHLPICVTAICDILPNRKSKETTNNALLPCQYFLRWDKADTSSYYYYTGHHIQPILQTLDNYIKNCETLLPDTIDNIYNDIISVLTTGANNFVPARQKNFYKFWWDEELTALKEAAIESNRLWKASGKPRQGFIFNKRQRCRAQYRKAIREAEKQRTTSYTNTLHEALLTKDGPTFWKCWRSKFEGRPNCTQVDGCTKPEVIADNFMHTFLKFILQIATPAPCRYIKNICYNAKIISDSHSRLMTLFLILNL